MTWDWYLPNISVVLLNKQKSTEYLEETLLLVRLKLEVELGGADKGDQKNDSQNFLKHLKY